jgi:hypothetical protein
VLESTPGVKGIGGSKSALLQINVTLFIVFANKIAKIKKLKKSKLKAFIREGIEKTIVYTNR